MRGWLLFVATVLGRSGTSQPPFEKLLSARLEPLLAATAAKHNCSLSAALRFANGSRVSLAAGYTYPPHQVPAKVDDPYVWGSVTKLLTGVDLLDCVEQGLISLNDTVHPVIDEFFSAWHKQDPVRWNFTSME